MKGLRQHLVTVLLLLLPKTVFAKSGAWYDCSKDEGIVDPKFKFLNVTSVPQTVTKHSGQKIYKTILYDGVAGVDHDLETVSADLHQFYFKFEGWWTFVHVHKLNQCGKEGSEGLCPFRVGDKVELTHAHSSLGWYTPYGMYRSRQLWRNGSTGEALGCVDMEFEYRAEKTQEEEENAVVDTSLR